MKNRRGFTLVELLISTLIFLLLLAAIVAGFSNIYRPLTSSFGLSRSESSIPLALELINSDLRKVGYSANGTITDPCEYGNNWIYVKFIDYDESSCADKDWNNVSCRTCVKYYLSDNRLMRDVDSGCDGSSVTSSVFPDSIIVEEFRPEIASSVSSPLVIGYKLKLKTKGLLGDRIIEIKDKIIAYNCDECISSP
ncbi:PilW family protein [Thermodesulfatator atlanticus]|uniref:PilW family protein n=1 Tax=Thermodesulfatator atlanticus TaxID=501497 RepID=UPI0003B6A887|nr:prepilin-type N-terminal cleavage/methylation domain-containing protein [Thermodesulfatator atlanticus]